MYVILVGHWGLDGSCHHHPQKLRSALYHAAVVLVRKIRHLGEQTRKQLVHSFYSIPINFFFSFPLFISG